MPDFFPAAQDDARTAPEPPGATGPGTPEGPGSWMEALDQDLRGHQALSGFGSPADLARAFLSAQERLEPLPGEYRIELPEEARADRAAVEAAREMARDIGLTQRQLDRLVRFDLNRSQVYAGLRAEQASRGLAALRSEWGPDFGRQVDLARRGAQAFAPAELKALLAEDPVVGNHPGLIRLFAELGRRVTEDRLAPPGGSSREKTIGEVLYPYMNQD